MSSNLHRNSTESNKHSPKGFDVAVDNMSLIRDERGQSRYVDNLLQERAENLVNGNSAPPTTTEGHIYVLIDEGSGAVHVDWQGASYNDVVRIQGGIWASITPVSGYLILNKTNNKYYKFSGSIWEEFGVGAVVEYFDDAEVTPLTPRLKIRAVDYIEFEDDAINEETIIKIRPTLLLDFTSTEIIEVDGQFYLALDENKLYQGNAQGLAVGKTLSQVLDGATDTLSASSFHLVGGFIEPYLDEGDIYVGNVNGVAIGQPIATALNTLAVETGIRFKIGIDGKVAIDLPEGEIIKGNANNEGVASPIISGNNKVLATNNIGVVYEADTVDFADILTGTATVDGLLSTTDLNAGASGVKGSFKITNIVIENTTANAVTIDIGSNTGLNDIASAVVVGANGFVDVGIFKALFSKTVEQDIYVSSADWNSSNLIIKISVQKVF